MKNRIQMKRILLIITLLIIAIPLCAFESKDPVELLIVNLIDLDKAIERAEWGGTLEEETSEEDNQEETETSDKPDSANSNTDNYTSSVTITVNMKDIILDEKIITTDDLRKFIKENITKEKTVYLRDSYAEAHVYRAAISVIEEEKKEIGFHFEKIQ